MDFCCIYAMTLRSMGFAFLSLVFKFQIVSDKYEDRDCKSALSKSFIRTITKQANILYIDSA